MKLRQWLSLVPFALTIAACGLVIDPDALVSGADEPDAGSDASAGDGGDASLVDARPPVPGCTPTGPEICGDGIDNDCNGDTDCADPQCVAGFACVDSPPDGWTTIAITDATRPACPAGFTGSTDVRVVQGSGAHTCACSCGTGCTGNITVTKGVNATCTAGAETFTPNTAGVCTAKTAFDLPAFARLTTPGCPVTNAVTRTNATSGRTCVPEAKPGAGCTGPQVCVAKAVGFTVCVAKNGPDVCPTGYTKQKRTGTTATDARVCTGCSCTNTCNTELELWGQPQCNGVADVKLTTATNPTCSATIATNMVRGYKATTTGSCAPLAPSVPSGALSFENEKTICCK